MEKIPVRQIKTSSGTAGVAGGFRIRRVASLLAGKDMTQPLHRHNYFYVLVLEKGRGEHAIDFVPYAVQNHAVFFMRPGQVHQLSLRAGSTGYLMEFDQAFYSPSEKMAGQVLRRVSSKNFCAVSDGRFKKLLSILDAIGTEFSSREERYQEVIQSALNIFFIALLRQSHNPKSPQADTREPMQERLEELLTLIEKHVATHKQVGIYAEKMNLTAYQLNAVTKALLGKTCSEVINDAIILEAKRNLLATTNQVNQVALYLGYEDVSYFIRFFKKHTGHSPEAFRQNFR